MSTRSRRTLSALQSLPDLDLQLIAADATSTDDMRKVVRSLEIELGGCMLLSVVLVDRPFVHQTRDSYDAAFDPKTVAFETLQAVTSVEQMEFCMAFTSVSGFFGNAGQTNYAR